MACNHKEGDIPLKLTTNYLVASQPSFTETPTIITNYLVSVLEIDLSQRRNNDAQRRAFRNPFPRFPTEVAELSHALRRSHTVSVVKQFFSPNKVTGPTRETHEGH